MKTLLLVAALSAPTALLAQVRIQTSPGAYAYVVGDPDRPMIGVSTRSTGKRDTLGLLVESVTRGGPAEQAGIEEGDRLVSVNTVNLRLSPADAGESDMNGVANRRLIRELEKQKAGAEVELRVYRDGNTRTMRVKTVTANELNNNNEFMSATRSMLRTTRDRAVLGISLGGNGSRRDTLGILVIGVTDDGPAGKAGVEEGDRVAAINGVDLRVASEDAGDAQASSARINRLNREMEKVKAGDAVELRVYSAGQTRTVRVDAMKASDLQGEGFFFNNGAGVRMLTIPRAVRVRPPGVEFDDLTTRARTKAELENHLRSLQETLRESVEPTARLRDQLQTKAGTLRSSATL
jgi:predicted metalloprotease with PDZ domain